LSLEEYTERANTSIMKILQAEHYTGVERLNEILEVPGIDLVICGPMDLSASIGKLGKVRDPEVVALMRKIIEACRAAKIPYGLSMGYDLELAKFWIEEGAQFVSLGTAYDYFRIMSMQVLGELKSFK
jgi:2-keto-3-deoxy-L-rhamnonate aldolase RhmA